MTAKTKALKITGYALALGAGAIACLVCVFCFFVYEHEINAAEFVTHQTYYVTLQLRTLVLLYTAFASMFVGVRGIMRTINQEIV